MKYARLLILALLLFEGYQLLGQSKYPAQMAQSAPTVQRSMVIPKEVIARFKLEPVRGQFTPYLLGEDGQPYSIDDVVAVLFELTKEHWQLRK